MFIFVFFFSFPFSYPFSSFFFQVSRRFPSLQHLVSCGLMTKSEVGMYQRAEQLVGNRFEVIQVSLFLLTSS